MIYKNLNSNPNVCTFISQSLKDYYGSNYQEVDLNEKGSSSSSYLKFKFVGSEVVYKFVPYWTHGLTVNDIVASSFLHYYASHDVHLFCTENSFILRSGTTKSDNRYPDSTFSMLLQTDKGILVTTLADGNQSTTQNREVNPVMVNGDSIKKIENLKPISFTSDYIGKEDKGEYFSSEFQFISSNYGVINTEMIGVAGEIGYLSDKDKMVLPSWLTDGVYGFRIPMSLVLFDK